jgi:hypothetical protein
VRGGSPEMMLSEQRLDPFSLPPGTQIGPWRVKAYEGGGAYGLVFRAVRVGEEQAGDVALKVACYPREPRFQREVALLSRVDHPSVPRLLDHGEWQAPGGEAHPYIVMEWIEGLELYAYKLVTQWYLPPVEVRPEGEESWRLEWPVPRPAAEMNPRVEPGLSALMVRMLARQPQERPAAAELAAALEQVARKAGPSADMPLFVGEEPVAAVESPMPIRRNRRAAQEREASSRRRPPWAHGQAWAVYAACTLLGAVISAMAVGWGLWLGQQARGNEGAQPAPRRELQGEKPVGVGDASLTAPDKNAKEASGSGNPSGSVPQTPLKDQRRAPHCVPDVEATINGGCWVEVPTVKPPCKDPLYEWQGTCYVPSFPRLRRPTSEPP